MLRICRSHSVPNRYSLITNHYVGVHDIMFSLYDDEQIQKAMMRDARKEGRMEGRMEGIDAMIANMRKAGISDEMIQNIKNMSQRPTS